MQFDIITLFPEAFSYLQTSIIKKAQEKGIIKIKFWNPRDFTFDKHKTVDDRPYGGGPGMVIKFEPVYLALEQAKKEYKTKKRKIILTSPAGKIFNQNLAKKLSQEKQIIIICGHYEGIDARIEKFVDLKISLGKFMLSGGEIPAMAIIDAVSRFLPGVLHNPLSQEEKRFGKLYSLPVYTRPPIIKVKNKILKVPKVLVSGNHKLIDKWRQRHLRKIL